VHLLKHVGLDEKLVETLACLLGTHLLNGSEERVRLVQSVQEANGLVNSSGIVLPQVQQLKSLLKVVQPRSETSGGHPRLLSPLSTDLVEVDILHEIFHSGSHGQLSLKSELKVLQISNNLVDESVDKLTLLKVDILVRTTGIVSQFGVNFINWKSLGLDLDFVKDSFGEISRNVYDSGGTITRATTLGLKLNKNGEKVVTLGSSEINFSVGVHSKSKRGFRRQFSVDVLNVLVVSSCVGALERGFSLSVRE
jgi:hypothetical protein